MLTEKWLRRKEAKLERRALASAAGAIEDDVRGLAEVAGLSLTVTGKATSPHWQFRLRGEVVLHYWPSAGSCRAPEGNKRMTGLSPSEALGEALRAAGVGL